MKRNHLGWAATSCLLLLASHHALAADVFNLGGVRNTTSGQWSGAASLELVPVGDPGNSPDTATRHGSVGYNYNIGKYDVTSAQYAAFLNAVAATSDPYNLYNALMAASVSGSCGITQVVSSGLFSYSVDAQHQNFPVNNVNWGSAARFCNWLENGQPVAAEGPGTTETGSYTIDGALTNADLMAITRNSGAQFAIPSANEWYKAAYYKAGSTNAGYWAFPTRSNTAPSHLLSSTGVNNANYYVNGYTDPLNYLTSVGAFASSPGPYGTFDQGGDVFQWTEQNTGNINRAQGGGNFLFNSGGSGALWMQSTGLTNTDADNAEPVTGFRIVEVPEPATLGLIGLSAIGALLRPRKVSC